MIDKALMSVGTFVMGFVGLLVMSKPELELMYLGWAATMVGFLMSGWLAHAAVIEDIGEGNE